MSGLSSLLENLQHAYARIAEVESIARSHPGDIYVLGNLSSLKRAAQSLEKAWEEEARFAQKEICRYRILPSMVEQYHVRQVAKSLEAFQDLFSQVYDATINKIRSRAQFSADVAETTALNVGFMYPGSLGVALTVDGKSELFSGKYDDVVRSFLDMMKLRQESDVRKLAEEYGLGVVKRAYDWSKINASAQYGIDVGWTTSLGHKMGTIADVDDFRRNVDLIGAISDSVRNVVRVSGLLVGIDSKTKRFRFVQLAGC